LLGIEISVATPPGYGLSGGTVKRVEAAGGKLSQTNSVAEAVIGADAVCTDVWVSMGQEQESVERLEAFRPYQVSSSVMALGAPGAVFLHCLPAHRGDEVTADVIDGPASLVWPQAANRLRAARGLLLWMFARP